ncbi:hypothetical protein PanWU01x14_174390, partial [Parasponia andersonii]
ILTIDSSHSIERIGFHTGYTKTIILSKNKTALNCQTFCYIGSKRSSLFCHHCPHNRSPLSSRITTPIPIVLAFISTATSTLIFRSPSSGGYMPTIISCRTLFYPPSRIVFGLPVT